MDLLRICCSEAILFGRAAERGAWPFRRERAAGTGWDWMGCARWDWKAMLVENGGDPAFGSSVTAGLSKSALKRAPFEAPPPPAPCEQGVEVESGFS